MMNHIAQSRSVAYAFFTIFLMTIFVTSVSWHFGLGAFAPAPISGVKATSMWAEPRVVEANQSEIVGQVTSTSSGDALEGIEVRLFEIDGANSTQYTFTDSDGIYRFDGLAAGQYEIGFFSDFYLAEWYNNRMDGAMPDPVTVGTDTVVDAIDAALRPGGIITGIVTSAWGGQYISTPDVAVMDANGEIVATYAFSSHHYEFKNLPVGQYRLRFNAMHHHTGYYPATNRFDQAAFVTVREGQVTANIDMELTGIPSIAAVATSPGMPNAILVALAHDQHPLLSTNGGRNWHVAPDMPWQGNDPRSTVWYPNTYAQVSIVPRAEPEGGRRLIYIPDNGKEIVYRSGDAGGSWAQYDASCWSGYGVITRLLHSPSEPNTLYLVQTCVVPDFFGSSSYAKLSVSRDAGLSWTWLDMDVEPQHVVLSPLNENHLFIGPFRDNEDTQTWAISNDGGTNWENKHFPIDNLVLDANDPMRLYGFGPNVIGNAENAGARSLDGGEQWEIWSEQPCPGEGSVIGSYGYELPTLLAHPTITGMLLLRCTQGLYRSIDGGDNWTQLADTPGFLLAPDYGTPGRILWAKKDGLWVSADNGATWQLLLPNYNAALVAQESIYLPSLARRTP